MAVLSCLNNLEKDLPQIQIAVHIKKEKTALGHSN